MYFKKVDVLLTEAYTKEQVKSFVLTELNKIQSKSQSFENPVCYIALVSDLHNKKNWVCVDSKTKNSFGLQDELICLQDIISHTTKDLENATEEQVLSAKFIRDNFIKLNQFNDFKNMNNEEITNIKELINLNTLNINNFNTKFTNKTNQLETSINQCVQTLNNHQTQYNQFTANTNNLISGINDILNNNIYTKQEVDNFIQELTNKITELQNSINGGTSSSSSTQETNS